MQMHYLLPIMLARHLLALFALFSGIAALEAPVHAQVSQSQVQSSRQAANSSQNAASESCTCPERARERNSNCPKREQKRSWTWLPSWLRPSVILGSDRALE